MDNQEEIPDSVKEKVQEMLDTIKDALANDPDNVGQFINEYGDFTIAIPLSGGKEALDAFMEREKLMSDINSALDWLLPQIESADGRLSCCFTGHRPKYVPWIEDESDMRTKRLWETLYHIVKCLSMRGVSHYIAGNAEGFDLMGEEAVIESNKELEMSKDWDGVSDDWRPATLEVAIPFDGHNVHVEKATELQEKANIAHVVSTNKSRVKAYDERNKYMVDNSDILIGFVDTNINSGTFKTVQYAMSKGKAVITIDPDWFENDWPNGDGISLVPPRNVK